MCERPNNLNSACRQNPAFGCASKNSETSSRDETRSRASNTFSCELKGSIEWERIPNMSASHLRASRHDLTCTNVSTNCIARYTDATTMRSTCFSQSLHSIMNGDVGCDSSESFTTVPQHDSGNSETEPFTPILSDKEDHFSSLQRPFLSLYSDQPPKSRSFHTAVEAHGRIWISCGRNATEAFDDLYALELVRIHSHHHVCAASSPLRSSTARWERSGCGIWRGRWIQYRGPGSPRAYHVAVLDKERDRMILHGGKTVSSSVRYLDELLAFQFATHTWEHIPQINSCGPRAYHCAAMYGMNSLLCIGGHSEYTRYDIVSEFNFTVGMWTHYIATYVRPQSLMRNHRRWCGRQPCASNGVCLRCGGVQTCAHLHPQYAGYTTQVVSQALRSSFMFLGTENDNARISSSENDRTPQFPRSVWMGNNDESGLVDPFTPFIPRDGGSLLYWNDLRSADDGDDAAEENVTSPVLLNSSPLTRSEKSVAFNNKDTSARKGCCILFGGELAKSFTDSVRCVHPMTRTWTTLSGTGEYTAETPASSTETDTQSDDRSYFPHGVWVPPNETLPRPEADLSEADPNQQSQEDASECTQHIGPKNRGYHMSWLDARSGVCVVWGGYLHSGKFYNDAFGFDPWSGEWCELEQRGDVPCSRASGTVTSCSGATNVIMFGGDNGMTYFSDVFLGTVRVFSSLRRIMAIKLTHSTFPGVENLTAHVERILWPYRAVTNTCHRGPHCNSNSPELDPAVVPEKIKTG